MAAVKSVWGIDIGQSALKALKLHEVDGQLQAEAFDIIEHPKILSQPDADRPQLIQNALDQFLLRNPIENTVVVVAVPGQSSLTRFVKLPPVEPKRIPSIVRFEAEQQIPFDINEVIWRWQSFPDPDSPDVQVGIFAIKRADVAGILQPFNQAGVEVDTVQMAPLSLYNFMTYDQQVAPEGATVLVDIGADSTNLVVADGTRVWTRLIQLGGNNFTESLVKAFKLSFSKAEKLKRSAATSKYARQIFQAMRPVFSDLVQEIQRSIGYYNSLHRDARFKRVLGLGNGFRLPGLQKFLEQNLNIPVVRIDAFNALQPSPTISAPQFTENVLSFAVAYGLALQGLGLTRVDTNLLPEEIASRRRWSRKRGWFGAAAAVLVVAAAGAAVRGYSDLGAVEQRGQDYRFAENVANTYSRYRSEYQRLKGQGREGQLQAEKAMALLKQRDFWPTVVEFLGRTVHLLPAQGLIGDAAGGLDQLSQVPPERRGYVVVTKLESTYLPAITDVTALLNSRRPAAGGSSGEYPMGGGRGLGVGSLGYGGGSTTIAQMTQGRGFLVVVDGRCPLNRDGTRQLLLQLLSNARQLAGAEQEPFSARFEVLDAQILGFPTMAAGPQRLTGGLMPYMPEPEDDWAPASADGTTATQPVGSRDPLGVPIEKYTHFRIGMVLRLKEPAAGQ